MKHVVAVYLVDRAYGGPEEGGWWYDTGELIRIVATAPNADVAYAKARHLNRVLNRTINRHRRPTHSVLSEGVFSAEVYKEVPPMFYPEQRPHYE